MLSQVFGGSGKEESRPFYRKWPERCRNVIRDCRPKYVIGTLLSRIQAQRPPNAEFLVKVKEKVDKVIDRGYITPCDKVKSLTLFFPISKTYLEVDGW